MSHRQYALLLNLFVVLNGCATDSTAVRPHRLAVFPFRAVGLTTAQTRQLRKSVGRAAKKITATRVVKYTRVDDEIDQQCAQKDPEVSKQERREACGFSVGSELRASHVLFGAIGGLGKTYVVRLGLLNVRRSAVTRSLEETRFGNLDTVAKGLQPMARKLFGIPKPKPWYGQWWVWTAAAAAVTAAIVIPLALPEKDPYKNVPLP